MQCCITWPPLQWRHNGHDNVSNHQPHHCLLNRIFGCRSKKTSKLRVTGVCVGNSPGTGEFPAQMASNAENVSIWWRHHVYLISNICLLKKMSVAKYVAVLQFSVLPYEVLCISIWRHKSGPTIVQVIACCLTTPSHYPNQHWLIMSDILRRPILLKEFKIPLLKTSLKNALEFRIFQGHWVKVSHVCHVNVQGIIVTS